MKDSTIRNNVERLKSMHTVIRFCNDEDAYCSWISLIPDEPDEDDFEFIAGDEEEMKDACSLFRRLIKTCGQDGFFTGGGVY